MSQIHKITRQLAKTFLLGMGLTLVACGGGGGGGTSNNIPTASVQYTGVTSEATIDSNATALDITKAYIAANQNNVGGLVTGATTATQTQIPLDERSKNILIEKLKQQVISSLNRSSIATSAAATITGNCTINSVPGINNDGSVSDTVFTDTSTEGSGKLSYNNLCIFDAASNTFAIVNGDVYYTVKGDIQAGIIDSLILNIPSLSIYFNDLTSGNSFSETISEYISFVFEYDTLGNLTKLTLSMYSDIDVAGTVYRFEVVVISTSATNSSTTVKFYHPTYGSVTYIDNLSYVSCINGLPDGGNFTIITSTTTYTITPSVNCDNTYTIVTS